MEHATGGGGWRTTEGKKGFKAALKIKTPKKKGKIFPPLLNIT